MHTSMHTSNTLSTLVEENRGLVGTIVNRILCQYGLDKEGKRNKDLWNDLFQEGIRGLMRAAKAYDPSRAKFSTYAGWWIQKYVRDTVKDILHRQWTTVSLDIPVGDDDDATRIDFIADDMSSNVFDTVARRDECRNVSRLLSDLPDRDRRIVELRLGLHGSQEHTLREISEKMGISIQRVDTLYKKALGCLRRQIAA